MTALTYDRFGCLAIRSAIALMPELFLPEAPLTSYSQVTSWDKIPDNWRRFKRVGKISDNAALYEEV